MNTPQRKVKIETTLAELQVELLYCFTHAADRRAQAREYSEQAERHDQQAQWLRGRTGRLQRDLMVIEITARGE